MPKYNYKCKECGHVFEAIHGMSERLTDCDQCNTIGTLARVPYSIATQYKDNKTGKVVDDYIEEAKREVEEEKTRLKEQDWKSD